jgi:predicted nucleotide-binding protein
MYYLSDVNSLIEKVKEFNWKFERNKSVSISLQIKTKNNMIINFNENTKKIWIQGKKNDDDLLNLNNIIQSSNSSINNSAIKNNKIYIVHGHDEETRKELELMLYQFGLTPVVSQENANGGLSIIEGVNNDMKECSFGLVLMTPDDMGYSKNSDNDHASPRARQNVIFEFGMLFNQMPKKIAILKKGKIEMPSDINGILYIEFNEIKDVREKLRKEFKEAKIKLNDDSNL